jgi:hypothetical protein
MTTGGFIFSTLRLALQDIPSYSVNAHTTHNNHTPFVKYNIARGRGGVQRLPQGKIYTTPHL